MYRPLSMLLAFPVLCVALAASGQAADDDSKMVGLWQEDQNGAKVVWVIGYWNGKWSVSAAMHKDGKKIGSWQGTDARVADGKLTFMQKRGPDAPESVVDGALVTVTLKDADLSYTADKGGTGTLTRSKEVALAPDVLPAGDGKTVVVDNKPNPNPDKPNPKPDNPPRKNPPPPNPGGNPPPIVVEKPPEGAKKYAGMWLSSREADGYRSIWTIKIGEDSADVSITNLDPKGKKASCYITGDKVHFEDGKLVFNQKMSANCPRHWFRNVKTTVELGKDSLAYSCFGAEGSLTKLTAAQIEAGYVGTWSDEYNGLTEIVIIRKMRTGWQIGANLMRGDRKVSGWRGQDVKFADGKLTFTQKMSVGAPAGWPDKSQYTLEWDGDTLNASWVNGETKGEMRQLILRSK